MPARLIPPHVSPATEPLGRLAFIAAFVRNPLRVLPRAAYEEDFVPLAGGRLPRVWVTAPSMIKSVLLDERDKFGKLTQIRLLGPMLGKGILTSEGADWKWQRQAAAPMFRPQDLGSFVPSFVRAAEDTLARWRAAPGLVHEIDAEMRRTTFEVISATLLPAADAAFALTFERSIRSLRRSGGWDILYASMNMPRWFPRPGRFSAARAIARLRSTVAALVRARREARAGGGERDDLLHRLIAARDPETGRSMDEEQLVDNLLTFYLAGHDTTATALTWTLYLLARSPVWSAALEDEIERVTGGEAISAAHVEKLVLTQQVLKESMRLYPPVPMMSRQAIGDARIDGHLVRAGTSVLLPIYAIHRHTKRWENPDEFDPARFAPEKEKTIARYQYMPFGAGPRICIGMSFAMIEAMAILGTFLRRARFAPVPGREPVPVARVTLVPKGGMPLEVRHTSR
jgi:cytochrome P450